MADNLRNFDVAKDHEELLCFDHFNMDTAWEIGNIIVRRAKEGNLSISAEIWIGNYQVFRCALPGTNAYNAYWMQRKVNTVNLIQKSTLRAHYMAAKGEGDLFADGKLPESEYAIMGGGFPIFVKNTGFIGVICVSGLTHTQDHQLVADSIAEYLGLEKIARTIEED